MSIVALKKITLMAMLKDKSEILSTLQSMGCLHLLPLKPGQSGKIKVDSVKDRADEAHSALRFLSESKIIRKQITRKEKFNVNQFVSEVSEVKSTLRLANDKRDFLINRIRLFEPWGDIYFPPHKDLNGYRFWFYVLPHNKTDALNEVELPWQIVSKSNRFSYVVVISKDEPDSGILPVPRSHLGSDPLSELRLQLEDIEVEIENLLIRREQLTRYLFLFRLHLNDVNNEAVLKHAHDLTLDDNGLVVIQGWLPADNLAELEGVSEQYDCAYVAESVNENDRPPTLLDQPEALSASKDLSVFYQVPDYHAWDPSRFLFFSFSVFFAMILADAGYALVLGLVLWMLKGKINAISGGNGYLNLGVSLCGFTLVYGALVGSYFGYAPSEGSLLAVVHILDLTDFDTMMKLSIVIGVVHICMANLMLALSSNSLNYILSRFGWITLIGAALFYWMYQDEAGISVIFRTLMVTGALMILIFSCQPKEHTFKSWLFSLKDGVLSLANIMTAFGDVLSYMRLFALGLASASLAQTFNQLAENTYQSSPGIGLLAAILILVVGHFLNLMLSLISGLVHGLRLNYIEFYKWGLPKEGVAFQRFAKKEMKP